MFWCYPLPAGIGAIVIILLILAIPAVPIGIGLGILIALASTQVILSGQFEILAYLLLLLPAIIYGAKIAKTERTFAGRLETFGLAIVSTLPITSTIGLLLLSLIKPNEKQYLFTADVAGDPVATPVALEKWHSSIEAYTNAQSILSNAFILSFGFIALILVVGGILILSTKLRSNNKRKIIEWGNVDFIALFLLLLVLSSLWFML